MVRARFHAPHAENTFRCILLFAGIAWNFHIHRADPFALSAGNTSIFIHLDPDQRPIAHRLQKYGDWTHIFAKSSIISAYHGQCNTDCIIQKISNDEAPPHNPLDVLDTEYKERSNENKRSHKNEIAQEHPFFPLAFRRLIGQ